MMTAWEQLLFSQALALFSEYGEVSFLPIQESQPGLHPM
jgi:hypothetical protein